MSGYPTVEELERINREHAPNSMGNTLLQRVYNQLSYNAVEALKAGDQEKAVRLANAAGKLEPLAFAPDFDIAYKAALDI